MRNLFRHPRRVGKVLAVFFRLFFAPALHLPGADKRSGPVRMRAAFEQLGGAWVKLGQMLALRYDLLPVRVLRRAVRPAEPGRAVQLRRGAGHRPGRARRRAGPRLRRLRAAVVRRGIDRPGPSGGPAQRRSGRGQGPAPAHPRDPPGRHPPHVLGDVAARPQPGVRRRQEPRGHRRVRALDRGRARLPRRGPPGRAAPRSRARRPVRADRARLSRLHDLARADRRADRGHPADRGDGRQA